MHSGDVSKSLYEIVPLLKESGINYWLGRGVLRHWILKDEIGDRHSDLDFHIWKKDENKLQEILRGSFEENSKKRRDYKSVFKNKTGGSQVEFMFLWSAKLYSSLVYHKRDNGEFYFLAKCVESFEMKEVDGIKVRVPVDISKYMMGLYGPEWRDEKDGDKDGFFKNNPQGYLDYLNKL